MTTLKQARETDNLAQFAREHRRDLKGDAAAFNHTLAAMARKSKVVPATSKKAGPAD